MSSSTPKFKIGDELYVVLPITHYNTLMSDAESDSTLISNDIRNERDRQERLHPQKINLEMRYVTIIEELGEVAEALQDKNHEQVYRELIESASLCIRMAEEVINTTKFKGE